jgi:hypothetical protein
MKILNRKNIILLIFILLILLIIFAVIRSSKNKKASENIISTNIPTIAGVRGLKSPVEFVSSVKFEIPEKAALLGLDNPQKWSEEKVKEIAGALGFSTPTVVANDINSGKTYIYSNQKSGLTIYPEKNYIIYSQHILQKPSKILEEKIYVEKAESFINNIPLNNKYYFSFINYSQIDALNESYIQTDRNNANTVLINLSPSVFDKKIMIKFPDFSLATVYFNLDGSITKAVIREIGNATLNEQEYSLKTLEDIKNSGDEFIMLTIDNQIQPNLESIKNNIINIKINSIELVYLYENTNSYLLQPVFLIKGGVVFKDKEGLINASFYLPAFAE